MKKIFCGLAIFLASVAVAETDNNEKNSSFSPVITVKNYTASPASMKLGTFMQEPPVDEQIGPAISKSKPQQIQYRQRIARGIRGGYTLFFAVMTDKVSIDYFELSKKYCNGKSEITSEDVDTLMQDGIAVDIYDDRATISGGSYNCTRYYDLTSDH